MLKELQPSAARIDVFGQRLAEIEASTTETAGLTAAFRKTLEARHIEFIENGNRQIASMEARAKAHRNEVQAILDAKPSREAEATIAAAEQAKATIETVHETLLQIRDLRQEELKTSLTEACQAAATHVEKGLKAGLRDGKVEAIASAKQVAEQAMKELLERQTATVEAAIASGIHTAALSAGQTHVDQVHAMVKDTVEESMQELRERSAASIQMHLASVATESAEVVRSLVKDVREEMATMAVARKAAIEAIAAAKEKASVVAPPDETRAAPLPATPLPLTAKMPRMTRVEPMVGKFAFETSTHEDALVPLVSH